MVENAADLARFPEMFPPDQIMNIVTMFFLGIHFTKFMMVTKTCKHSEV